MKKPYNKLLSVIISILIFNACSFDEPVPDNLSQIVENKEAIAIKLSVDNKMVQEMNEKLYSSSNNSRVNEMLNESTVNWEWVLSIPSNDSSTIVASVEIISVEPTTTITNLVGIYQNDSLVDMYFQELEPSFEYLNELVDNAVTSIAKQQFLANFSGQLILRKLDGTLISERTVGSTTSAGRVLSGGIMLEEIVVTARKIDQAFCRCVDTYTWAYEDYNEWINNIIILLVGVPLERIVLLRLL